MSELRTIYVSTVDQIEVLVLTKAKTSPVDLGFMKNYMKVEHDADDELIQKLIISAVQQVEHFTSRALMPKTLKAIFHGTEHWRALPIIPAHGITECKTVKNDGSETIHAVGEYQVIGGIENKSVHPPIIMTVNAGRSLDHVEISYVAGYLTTDIIPQVILETVWQLVMLSYQHRDLMAGECITIASNSALKQKLYPYQKPYL